jgi:cytoskeletal protein CcmA (bactofilin family)
MADVHISIIEEEMLDTILAPDVNFEGTLIFKKPLMIKGNFKGKIYSSSDLYVDEKAVVAADIEAVTVSVKGRVDGNIKAENRVELFASSVINGDIAAPEVAMETGCRFMGICTTTRKKGNEDSL